MFVGQLRKTLHGSQCRFNGRVKTILKKSQGRQAFQSFILNQSMLCMKNLFSTEVALDVLFFYGPGSLVGYKLS